MLADVERRLVRVQYSSRCCNCRGLLPGLLTGSIRQDLERLKKFSFRRHPAIQAEQERLDAWGTIVRRRIKEILAV